MAKRKRLTPPLFSGAADPGPDGAGQEAGQGAGQEAGREAGALPRASLGPSPLGLSPRPGPRAPIAQIAGDAAAQSALEDLAAEVQAARAGGRFVQALPLAAVTENHLVRDRMSLDDAEMTALKSSLLARGQQTPIEVVDLGAGRFGLISGWRRLQAVRALKTETGEARFDTIQALIKPIDTVSDSYVAMVEENEIRVGLSFYERAHVACEAVRLGVYENPAKAVQVLFANATPARRSKILSFVRLSDALGPDLRFPAAIPEKLGLALVKAIEGREGFAARLRGMLRKSPAASAEDERALLERALRKADGGSREAATGAPEVVPGIAVSERRGQIVLAGPGVTAALREEIEQWLRGKTGSLQA